MKFIQFYAFRRFVINFLLLISKKSSAFFRAIYYFYEEYVNRSKKANKMSNQDGLVSLVN